MSRLTELVKQENYEDFYRFSKESGIEVRYRYALGIQKAIDKLAEYEDLGTPNDIINLIKEAQIMLENNKAHKQSLKELGNSNSKLYKETIKLNKENTTHRLKFNKICDYLGLKIANNEECEMGCYSEVLNKVNNIKKYDTDMAQHEAEIRKQERLKVIAELEEWIKENHKYYICRTQTNYLQGKSFSPHMVGASISVYLDTFKSDLKQKLNEMKEV